MPKKSSTPKSSASLGFEAKLCLTADKLRNNMDAAEYKHVVLGLIFLKYISGTNANPEDPDEYKAENVFWVPAEARWPHLQASAKQPTIGKIVDDAMVAIERDNPRLRGVCPKDYARPGLDKQRLGELIDVIATVEVTAATQTKKSLRSFELFGCMHPCARSLHRGASSGPSGDESTPGILRRRGPCCLALESRPMPLETQPTVSAGQGDGRHRLRHCLPHKRPHLRNPLRWQSTQTGFRSVCQRSIRGQRWTQVRTASIGWMSSRERT
jgi:hypothetical protein